MQDPIGIPACFSSGDKFSDDPGVTITRSGQSLCMSVYRTKIADQCRLITITWCKNVLLHGLSILVEGATGESRNTCKVELKPWYFWRKQGSKRFIIDGGDSAIDIFWDLKAAKFNGETEPRAEYYVAVVCGEEVVLLLGDLRTDVYRKTGARPALIDPILVSKKEHMFGKKRFITRAKFHDKGRFHEICIERKCEGKSGKGMDPEMEIRIDGIVVIHVKHLQWKFRGNEMVRVNKVRVEVYWDIHDWLFSPGLRHALFIFKPNASHTTSSCSPLSSSAASTPMSSQTGSSGSVEGFSGDGSSEFSLFLYAWRVE